MNVESASDAEERLAGDAGWHVLRAAPLSDLAGYVSPSSTWPGGYLHVHVRSRVSTVRLAAYRSGFYGGFGGRLLWQRQIRALPPTAPVLLSARTRTWTAGWPESTELDTSGLPPGHYLIVAEAGGQQTWLPFTVVSPDMHGRVVILTENTTWQAYNAYGGASLYHGLNGAHRTRAYAVSFDRPLDYGHGAGDYPGNELPLLRLAERLRLPLAFATDTDLQAAPGLLDGARAVISLGHDEYWSSAMRAQLLRARDLTGTNLAFLGANAVYRHIRLQPLNGIPNRLEIDYKDPQLDPDTRVDPSDTTADWPRGPAPRDGKELTGGAYQCNPVDASLVLTNTHSWLTAGLAAPGTRLPRLLGSEYDKIVAGGLTPERIVSVARSPVVCAGRHDHADLSYYTVASGAAGVDVGTSTWVCVLDNVCGQRPIDAFSRSVVIAMTARILTEFARGPAGSRHPISAASGAAPL